MDYGYVTIDNVPVYQVSIDGQLVVTGDIIGGTSSGGGTLHANRIEPIPPVTAVQIDNIICETNDVSDNLLQASDLHSKHALDTSNSIVARGQFICVHDVDFTEPMGFCFGPNEDEVTGDFSFLVDDAAGAVQLASNIAGVITPMFSADKATGVVSFPSGVDATLITGNPINLANTLIVDDTANSVTVSVGSQLNCDSVQPNGDDLFLGAGARIQTSTTRVEIIAPYEFRADTINSFAVNGTAFLNTIKLGSGLLQPANVTDSVIQIGAKDDSTYGNPVSSALLYCDQDDCIKTKNTSGEINNLSSVAAFINLFREGNGTDTVITTADTFTRAATLSSAVLSNNFVQVLGATGFTYNGTQTRTMLVTLCAGFLATQNLQLVAVAAALNPTYNGSNELTSSRIDGSLAQGSMTAAGDQMTISSSFFVTMAQNDSVEVVISNILATDDINLRTTSITVQSFSAGTD